MNNWTQLASTPIDNVSINIGKLRNLIWLQLKVKNNV